MSELSDPKQRGLHGLEGDAAVHRARQISVQNSITPFFKVFAPIYAGYAALTSLFAIFIGDGSPSAFRLLSIAVGVVSLGLAVYILRLIRVDPNLPLFVYCFFFMASQACISLCKLTIKLAEGKGSDLFDWVTTSLVVGTALIGWLATWSLRKTVQV